MPTVIHCSEPVVHLPPVEILKRCAPRLRLDPTGCRAFDIGAPGGEYAQRLHIVDRMRGAVIRAHAAAGSAVLSHQAHMGRMFTIHMGELVRGLRDLDADLANLVVLGRLPLVF